VAASRQRISEQERPTDTDAVLEVAAVCVCVCVFSSYYGLTTHCYFMPPAADFLSPKKCLFTLMSIQTLGYKERERLFFLLYKYDYKKTFTKKVTFFNLIKKLASTLLK